MVWDRRVIELVGSVKIRPQIAFGQILEFDTDQKVSLPFSIRSDGGDEGSAPAAMNRR
jgi:hypothetical protein